MNTYFSKIFVFVPTSQYDTFKAAHYNKGTGDKYYNKVTFFEKTGELMTHGKMFAVNESAEFNSLLTNFGKLQTVVGLTELGQGDSNLVTRIGAIETLLSNSADSDTIINKVSEMLAWFNNVSESETGASLISDVAANKTAIGAQAVLYTAEDSEVIGGTKQVGDVKTPATGLYKVIEDLGNLEDLTGDGTETSGSTLSARIYALEHAANVTNVTSGSDLLVNASTSNGTSTVSSTQKLQDAVSLAETSLQGATTTTSSQLSVTYTSGVATINAITGTISAGNDGSLLVNSGDEGKLATIGNVATVFNSIEAWEEIEEPEPEP